ncbi:MAG TPA: FtsW/RodA/SpoVE family cell cycle protein, partial [Candidatus Paceibacterota bacterium]|nr:FtsW/RodA/SpoVE family cell cycle protein [Candidatus Paceibacterota bacterium]
MPSLPLPSVFKSSVDWVALTAALALCVLGLLTMNSFLEGDPFFTRQIAWIVIGVLLFFVASSINWRFLRGSGVAVSIFAILLVPLLLLILFGHTTRGARGWFDLGPFALQPAEFIKLGLIIVLAKYFSRRHIEIGNFKHILVSGAYTALVFALVALQPDFGSAIIVALVWLGMVLVSGISRTHLFAVLALGLALLGGLWFFGFEEYQKQRIMTFVAPTDILGAGYNAYQSTVAVGSGQFFGKGIGYGTQSKLRFLPEYQSDFIFAAFAEEWGFVGITIVFSLYGILFVRILSVATRGATNFETLFALGVLSYFVAHFTLHVGINLGVLPVTGTTIPFMSYGGSHILAE